MYRLLKWLTWLIGPYDYFNNDFFFKCIRKRKVTCNVFLERASLSIIVVLESLTLGRKKEGKRDRPLRDRGRECSSSGWWNPIRQSSLGCRQNCLYCSLFVVVFVIAVIRRTTAATPYVTLHVCCPVGEIALLCLLHKKTASSSLPTGIQH